MMGKVERIGIGNWKCGSELLEENQNQSKHRMLHPKPLHYLYGGRRRDRQRYKRDRGGSAYLPSTRLGFWNNNCV